MNLEDLDVNSFSIRECLLEEVEAVLDLWRRAEATPSATDNAENLRRAITESNARMLVAEAEGQLVGTILGTFDGWRGNIYRLAVLPCHRRQGVARALVAVVEGQLARLGARRITALVEKDHSCATGFWHSVGYGLDTRIVRHVRTLPEDGPGWND
jgi:ribosomal protein S18 acetylase RimI-like enzyme